MSPSSELKRRARSVIEENSTELVALADWIHAHPEIGWQEFGAVERICARLNAAGFEITPEFLGLDTAFHARYGSGRIRIGLIAEYDALPHVGHACGHNLITGIAVGAALGLAAVADELDLCVEVYGTPAEEGGGGKIELLQRGAFAGLELAMMAHPGPLDIAEARPLAVSHLHAKYTGRAAHAGAYPEDAVNANDAFIVAQVAMGLLRQQLPAGTRVHGIMTHAGEAPNIVPGMTEGRWYVRAETLEELESVEARVRACFSAGALATGASLEIALESGRYAEFRNDARALGYYRANATALGRVFDATPASRMNRASTDMGNVSQVVRAIHPYIGLDCLPATNHQAEFAAHCRGPQAVRALMDAAVALAWTGIDDATGDA